ncbi:MAG TPA: hypothetical protein VFR23_21905 [Jiangellaceae bacterium]|nr:hypothetical protein [Jiangellaceae bacterium]
MVSLPRSVRFAAWATMWFEGRCDPREVVDRVRGDDEPHELEGSPSLNSLDQVLLFWRKAGAHAVSAVLPRPGDPHGLAGPAPLSESAVAAGEAAVAVGAPYALVPRVTPFGPPNDKGHFVTWVWHEASPPPAGPNIAQADRELNEALLIAGRVLADLDVPAWRPEVAQLLDDLRAGRASAPLPHGYSPAAQALAARAARLWTIAEFALADDGGAVTAAEASARRDALRQLERAARHGLAAACNDRSLGR